jgi:hypothetical protein
MALLRLVGVAHANAVPRGRDQIAKANSSNATATRRVTGSSTTSS